MFNIGAVFEEYRMKLRVAACALGLCLPLVSGVVLAASAPGSSPAAAPVDLTGVWEARDDYVLKMATDDGKKQQTVPWQPWSLAFAKKERDADQAGHPFPNNNALCLPPGFVRQYKGNFPFMIVQTPSVMAFLFEENTRVNLIYMNQEHPANLTPTWYGNSVGRWEGDTLIIDTIGTNGRTPFPGAIPHSEAMHLIHHFRLIENGKAMEDRLTIDDPKAFTKPWQVLTIFDKHEPGFKIREYVCAENNQTLLDE